MKYFYLIVVVSFFTLNAMAMVEDDFPASAQQKLQVSPNTAINPNELTQEEQTLTEEIQKISQSEVISTWSSLFEQQQIQLDRAKDTTSYCPIKFPDGKEVQLPIHVLAEDYTLIVAAIGLSSQDVYALNQEIDPRVSAQSTLFWRERYLNSASIIRKELNTYNSAKCFQLNMTFIIEPNKNSIVSTAPKDVMSPTRDYKNAIGFALKKIKLLSEPEDIIKNTCEDSYNEVTLIGPPLFNKLFPNDGPSFTVKGIFVTPEALRQYRCVPSEESHKFLEYLSELATQKDIPIYLPPKTSRK